MYGGSRGVSNYRCLAPNFKFLLPSHLSIFLGCVLIKIMTVSVSRVLKKHSAERMASILNREAQVHLRLFLHQLIPRISFLMRPPRRAHCLFCFLYPFEDL